MCSKLRFKPNPSSTQKTNGVAIEPTTRFLWRKNRTISRRQSDIDATNKLACRGHATLTGETDKEPVAGVAVDIFIMVGHSLPNDEW
jgi:hypothetical protein